jgi:hypothetical protein
MMNARRMAEGVRIVGIYRADDRPSHYLATIAMTILIPRSGRRSLPRSSPLKGNIIGWNGDVRHQRLAD